uniref:histidine kinase n=1 Tax=uncultured Muribaculaceae bacterium TaxID=2301481 RepID=A0A6G8F4K7_9BACT|nr:hybrid sensor histidine kinase/response regulator [uncultured Muribaculaceae bacterium]
MWFGTIDGVHCYDGNNISIWRDPEVKTLGQVIYAIKEDSDGKLWIGSDMGLAVFDLKKEKFFSSPIEKDGMRIMSPVSDILFDSKGRMWITTAGNGVFCHNQESGETSHYVATGRINSDVITHALEDHNGTIWVASPEEGISRFDDKENIFIPVKSSPKGTISLLEDSKRNFWIGCVDGLYRFDSNADNWEHILSPKGHNVFQIRQMVQQDSGALIIASDEGLTVYDPATGITTTHKANLRIPDNLNDNYLHSLFIDNEKGLWIGTYFGGVNYIPHTHRQFAHYSHLNSGLPARIISVFAEADNNNAWIGSDDAGFFLWNRKDNSFKSFNNSSDAGLTYHNTHALLQDGDKLFIGMYMGGLDILDLSTYGFKNYKGGQDANSLYSSSIYALFRDSRGNIWIGTTKGLNKYRRDTDDFERVFDLNHADVEYIFEDSSGHIYACSLNQGLFRMDPENGKWTQFTTQSEKYSKDCGLPTYKISTGAEDRDGNLWFGTDGWGLLRFLPEKQHFERAPLPPSIRVVNKIIPEGENLWLTTSNGLYCYTPRTGKIQTFKRDSGLQDNLFLPNSGIKLSDGTILIGGKNGFNEFNPEGFEFRANDPKVILTDLSLFNRRASVDAEGSPLTSSLAYSDHLTIGHEHSIFSISVAVLSYMNPSRNNFLYKLDGFDPDWNDGPADGRVSYTNLPPGKYNFLVRASDGAGGWNEDSLSFPIEVLPPWWFSFPMKIIYGLLVISLLFLFYSRMKRKQQQELRIMTAQKDKELYQSKIDFFTHMVHEIRTPLTLILTPLESVMKSKRTVSDELPTLNVIARNGQRLLSLVNRLMDFRKMESGCVTVDLHPVDLRQEILEMYKNILPLAEAKGINVVINIPQDECPAMADSDALHHVIDNLLSNALKFTGDHIWIDLEESDDDSFRITVKDNGLGIDKDEQEKIFKPFYQVAEARPQDNIGTGIGLLLVRKYVELMNGSIQLKSTPGRGSEFSVSLPKADDGSMFIKKTSTVAEVMKPAIDNPIPENVKDRILIVEDNSELLNFLRTVFQEEYDVTCASNGKIALQFLAENSFDIVVSDVMMPEIDGIELCRRIKTSFTTSHIPVVLLTAKVENRDYIEGFENGADLYVSKPFSSDVLKAQVKGILKIRRQLRRNFCSNPDAQAVELVPNSRIDNEFLKKFEDTVMQHLSNPEFNVDLLAKELGVSRTGLFTKLKAVADMTPNALIKRIRLNEAARLIREERYLVNEACCNVGFASRSHFARYFQEQFGVNPAEYKSSVKVNS